MSDHTRGGSDYWRRINEEQGARNRSVTNRLPFYLLASLVGISSVHAVLGLAAAIAGRDRLMSDTPREGLVWLLIALTDLLAMRLWLRRHRRSSE